MRYLPVVVASFIITDLFIGFHAVTFFTWGSVIFIGLFSKYLKSTMINRISGALLGACLFFICYEFWSLVFRIIWIYTTRSLALLHSCNTFLWLQPHLNICSIWYHRDTL